MERLLLWVLLLFAAWRGYAHFAEPSLPAAPPGRARADAMEAAITRDLPVQADVAFTCDGRAHCSQMTSRAEAEFFVRHCPNTKMDGDHDGEPCENDSRF